ncbi:MAG: type II secretion system F family protein [Candidatus Sumerlaeia bacterium]|nr:type II secretion system F family protein [Candidatus Sumerlaeia bacterium]
MAIFVPAILLVILVGTLIALMRTWHVQALTSERLAERVLMIDLASEKRPRIDPVIQPTPVLGWAAGIATLVLCLVFGITWLFALAFTLVIGYLVCQIEIFIYEYRLAKFEQQLAELIDLMVAALHSGATLVQAMEIGSREVRKPLQPIVEEVAQRIYYGDDPKAVMRMLVEKLPTENYHLFATTLSVHWDVGGNLAPVLATVGSAIRDRIEVDRRMRATTAQSRLSAVIILLVTYLMAWIVYEYSPESFMAFAIQPVGQTLIALAILLQALGLIVLAYLNRVRV